VEERFGVAVTALDGSPSVRLGRRGVLVTRLIPGAPPGLTADALEQMGATLGRLHALPASPAGHMHLVRRAGSLPREDLAHARAWLASADPSLAAEHDAVRRAVEATHDCEDLPFALTHPDCHPGNMIQTPGGRVVLARTLAEATAQGRPPPEVAWWTGYTRAGEVAARALG
jgi:Ser/Thr protein kinase RdoA (MazF antagonist)